ncbi:MAG: hypothetical protein ACQEXV_24175 [Bacillota bacterium]
MAIIPLRQTVTIKSKLGTTDRFNRVEYGPPISYKCRIVEKSTLVRTKSLGYTTGAEAVSSAQIMLDKFVAVSMDDEISYTDEAGNARHYQPLTIEVKRGLNGKALLTVVYV